MPIEPSWTEYYRDEMDAAWLYRALARVESNAPRRAIFDNLAKVEDEHVERWRALFHEHGGEAPAAMSRSRKFEITQRPVRSATTADSPICKVLAMGRPR